MAYLFLGQDLNRIHQQIADLKKKILGGDGLLDFDFEFLHAHKLDSDTLKKALEALPAVAAKRLVVVHEAHRLSVHNKELIESFLEARLATTELVLISPEWSDKDAFVKKIRPFLSVTGHGAQEELNVFDITRQIDTRKPGEALKVLYQLLEGGAHPLQLIPGLIWFWGNKCRGRVTAEKFEDGLKAFQEADLNIKRSRLKAEQAVELLVVKLCALR